MRFHAGCFISLMGLLLGQPAVAYTHVYFGGGTPTLNDDGSLEIDGVHATGDGSSLNDVRGEDGSISSPPSGQAVGGNGQEDDTPLDGLFPLGAEVEVDQGLVDRPEQ